MTQNLTRLWWNFGTACVVKSIMFYNSTPGSWTDYQCWEVVGSTDMNNFVRIPTLWSVGGIATTEDTFSLKYDRKTKTGRYAWVLATDMLPVMGTLPNGHQNQTGAFTSAYFMGDANKTAFICSIELQNSQSYKYIGLSTVGSDTPYSSKNRSDTTTRTYARRAFGSYVYTDHGANLNANTLDLDCVGLNGDTGVSVCPSIGTNTISRVYAMPQVVTDTSVQLMTYKYWRIRATSAFLGACGTNTKAYFWKLGLYRNATAANADTNGLSSNNYLQQWANELAVSTNGATPTTVSSDTAKRLAMFVNKGMWTQRYGDSTTVATISGSNAVLTNAQDVAFGAELACIQFKLDVVGEIGAIRFPDNMYYDANVRGGTFILEAATAAAASKWIPMVVKSTLSPDKYLGREGILGTQPSAGIISAGNQQLDGNLKVFTIEVAPMLYNWPTGLDTLNANGVLVNGTRLQGLTVNITGGTSANKALDFNVHCILDEATPPTLGTTNFNCIVTDYQFVSPNWTLTFEYTPAFAGWCKFVVYVRSGEGTGALGTSALPTLGVLTSSGVRVN